MMAVETIFPFTVKTKCGEAEHEVIVTLTAWGMIEVFSPCQILPSSILKLAKTANCLKQISPLVKGLSQEFYCSEDQPISNLSRQIPLEAREFVKIWRGRLPEGAMVKLKEVGLTTLTLENLKSKFRSPDPNIRCSAIIMAGAMKKHEVIPDLVRLIEVEEEFCVQLAALWAILEMPNLYAAPTLRQWLNRPELKEGLKARLATALGQIKDNCAVEPLIEALRGKDPNLRRAAIWALGQIKDTRAVEPLIEIWKTNRVNEIREEVIEALGHIGVDCSIDFLSGILLNFSEPKLRRLAALALSETKSTNAVQPLVKGLGDGDEKVREAVAEALVQIGQPAVDPLISAMRSKGELVRRQAAKILRRIGLPAAQRLKSLLKEKGIEPRVRVLAEQTLNQILQEGGRKE